MRVTRQILGYQDLTQNPPKTLICDFSNAGQKPSKNPPAIPKKVEKPSKNPPPEGFLKVFEGFCHQKTQKRAARASARRPFLSFLIPKASGGEFFEGFSIFFGMAGGFFEGFWPALEKSQIRVFGGFWAKS